MKYHTPKPGYAPAKSGKPFSVEFEIITPAYARWVIDNKDAVGLTYGPLRNHGNRKSSDSRMRRYSHEMSQGWWATTHQGIAFDEDGNLIDGRNRLLAVIDSGVSVLMLVSRGVKAETFYLLDQGLARSAHQFMDGTHGTLRQALARTLMRLHELNGQVNSTIGAGQYPSYRILHFLDDNPHVAEFGIDWAPRAASVTRRKADTPLQSTSAAGVLLAAFTLNSSELTEKWFDELERLRKREAGDVTVESIAKDSPLWHFKVSPVADGNMTNVNYRRALLVADLFRQGKQARTFRGRVRPFDIAYINGASLDIDLGALKIDGSALGGR